MTTMFFAGIPLEGSGARPLEADLYGAEQQGVDHENLSATGNLNVGVVVDYDEHAQHYLNGGAKGDDQGLSGFSGNARHIPAMLPTTESTGYHGDNFGGDNNSMMQTTTLATPSSQNIDLPTRADTNTNSVSSYSNAVQSSGGAGGHPMPAEANAQYSNESGSESHGSNSSSSTENIYNTYNTSNTNYNSNEYNINENNYNYTQNNTYNEYDGGHDGGTGGGHGGGSGGEHGCPPGGEGGITNIFNTLVTNELNFANTITNETITTVNQTVNNTENIVGDLISGVGGVLNTVDVALTTVGNSVTQIVNIVDGVENTTSNLLTQVLNTADNTISTVAGGAENTVNGLLSEITGTVNNTLGTVTANLSGIENTTNGLLTEITGTVNNTVDHISGILGNVDGTLQSLTAPITNIESNILGGNTLNILSHDAGSIVLPAIDSVADITVDALNITGNTLSAPVSILSNDSLSLGSLPGDISNSVHDITQGSGDLIHNVVTLAGDVTGGILSSLNLPSLADVNVSALTQNLPQASGSLINVTASGLGESNSSAIAGTSGLLNVDTSLLSTSSAGSNAADGISVSLNPETLAPLAPSAGSINVIPEVTIPLPTASSSIPIVSSIASTLMETGNTIHEVTGNLLDPIVTLNALTQTSNVAAVDSGVLFTGGSATVGHDGSSTGSASTSSHDILHVGSLLHGSLLGAH